MQAGGSRVVTRDWAQCLSWKQQSVLSSSFRGPDNVWCPGLKRVTRWLRSVVQNNADPGHNYMRRETLPDLGSLFQELEYTTIHFATHLLQGLAIVAYHEPTDDSRRQALRLYTGLVERMHLEPESKERLDKRLSDMVIHHEVVNGN